MSSSEILPHSTQVPGHQGPGIEQSKYVRLIAERTSSERVVMLSEPEPQCGHTDMGTETRKQYKEADAAFICSKEEGKSKEFIISDGI